MRIIVTGGAGFIGSALAHYLTRETEHTVINVDKLTYAGSRTSLVEADSHARHHFVQQDIRDARAHAMSANKLHQTLNWRPRIGCEEGLRRTIAWYLENDVWSRDVTTGTDAIRKQGVSK